MATILLNKIWDELRKIWIELGDIAEKPIPFEQTSVSISQLVDLIYKRLKRKNEKTNGTLTQVLNENDLLPFSFLEKGQKAGQSVCCLVRQISKNEDLDKLTNAAKDNSTLRATLLKWYGVDPIEKREEFKNKAQSVYLPYASGFFVGGDYLITNRHVVEKIELLPEFCAVFEYEAKSRNQESDPQLLDRLDKYKFDPNFWITSSNEDLDYVLLKLQPFKGDSVSVKFQGVTLAKTLEGEIAPRMSTQTIATDPTLKANLKEFATLLETKDYIAGDPVHMIQHPGGRPKEVVVFNNRLVNMYQNFLEYETDAEPGSSGSPLFNTDWQVVGIHQATLFDVNENTERKIKGYLGIRMDCISADLREQSSSNQELLDFLDYLDGNIVPEQPQVFILAGRQRNSVLGQNDAQLEKTAMENLRKSILQKMRLQAPDVRVADISGRLDNSDLKALKLAIEEINKQRNPGQKGELAIELLVNRSGISTNKKRCIKLYYSAANVSAQKLALSLQTFLKQDDSSLSVSALPDSYTNTRGLMFCQKVNLPAVVIFVGDLSNASDRESLEKIQREPSAADSLGQSLTKGILEALEVLKNE